MYRDRNPRKQSWQVVAVGVRFACYRYLTRAAAPAPVLPPQGTRFSASSFADLNLSRPLLKVRCTAAVVCCGGASAQGARQPCTDACSHSYPCPAHACMSAVVSASQAELTCDEEHACRSYTVDGNFMRLWATVVLQLPCRTLPSIPHGHCDALRPPAHGLPLPTQAVEALGYKSPTPIQVRLVAWDPLRFPGAAAAATGVRSQRRGPTAGASFAR